MINYSKLKKLESQNKNTVNNKEMKDNIYDFITSNRCRFDIETYDNLTSKEQIDLGMQSYIELLDNMNNIKNFELLVFSYHYLLYKNMKTYLNIQDI